MYRIRFHGRGGQGVKTASRILGTALFNEGYEVQDAPRYGAERRGAPIFAYVRAARERIDERGVIERPDLVVVADDSLLLLSAVGIAVGVHAGTAVLIETRWAAERIAEHLGGLSPERIVTLLPPNERERGKLVGVRLAAGAARLLGVVGIESLERAVIEELADLGAGAVGASLDEARVMFSWLSARAGLVAPSLGEARGPRPDWIELSPDPIEMAAAAVQVPASSKAQRTGLWRSQRPEVDATLCHRCVWVCGTLCPDSAITVGSDGHPEIDLDHCKGCMICEAVCPFHAIRSVPEPKEAAS